MTETEKLTRVQRRQRDTREQIFRVAMKLFHEQGFDATTVVQITEAADIGKGTFFTYFPTKEAVLGHLGERLTEAMTEVVEAVLGAGVPVADIVERLFEAAAGWHETNRSLSALIVKVGLRSGLMEADAPNQHALVALLARVVETGQSRGELRADVRSADCATVLSGVYFATLMAWHSDGDARSLGERLRDSLRIVLEGMHT
jgi:AcrR family transcriptional regulator